MLGIISTGMQASPALHRLAAAAGRTTAAPLSLIVGPSTGGAVFVCCKPKTTLAD
jgi:hypothetical protein